MTPLFIAYGAFVLGGLLFFARPGNAPRKRLLFPLFAVAGSLFFLYITWMMLGRTLPWLIVAIVAGITGLNVRSTRFCGACGAMNRAPGPLGRPTTCRACRQPLDAPAPAGGAP